MNVLGGKPPAVEFWQQATCELELAHAAASRSATGTRGESSLAARLRCCGGFAIGGQRNGGSSGLMGLTARQNQRPSSEQVHTCARRLVAAGADCVDLTEKRDGVGNSAKQLSRSQRQLLSLSAGAPAFVFQPSGVIPSALEVDSGCSVETPVVWESPVCIVAGKPDGFPLVPIDELLKKRRISRVREASVEEVRPFLRWDGCSRSAVKFDVRGRTAASVQRTLRRRLAAELIQGRATAAFGEMVDSFQHPRCDDLESMFQSMPGADSIDWAAPAVVSNLDTKLWQQEHSVHCTHGCSSVNPSSGCYFVVMRHYMETGYEPALVPGASLEALCPPTNAYVELWNKEPEACAAAFRKLVAESVDVLSGLLAEPPPCVFPLLPVIRGKHLWRYHRDGTPYKVRLCMDFSTGTLNDAVAAWKFRYRTLDDVARSIQRGDFMCTIDISSFFLRLPASMHFRPFQSFQVPATYGATSKENDADTSGHQWRRFNGVIFGLKTAPAWASCVSAELARILEAHGVTVAGCFVDDLLLVASTEDQLERDLAQTLDLMQALGLPPAPGKTSSIAQEVVFLGMKLCSTDLSYTVSEEHRVYALALLDEALAAGSLSRKGAASMAGVLTWLATVVAQGRPRRNELYAFLKQQQDATSSEARVRLRGRLKRQLHWWRSTLKSRSYCGTRCWAASGDPRRVALLRSDASAEQGWGLCLHGFHMAGGWPSELVSSDNMLFKELFPVILGVILVGAHVPGSIFGSAVDNAGAAYSLNRLCCRDRDSLGLLRILAAELDRHHSVLLGDWVRRVLNGHGDGLSRVAPFIPSLQRSQADSDRWTFEFVVRDIKSGEARVATLTLPRDCGAGMVASPTKV